MFCRKCGIKFDDNSIFCPKCGEKAQPDTGAQEPQADKNSQSTAPFRNEFYKHIKSIKFFALVIFATVYYGIGVINAAFHFSASSIFESSISILYSLISLGLVVPALWMIYLDRSPHSAFVPLKFYALINLLKVFMTIAFGTLTVISNIVGKTEISNSILYLADKNISVYLTALISETAKSPTLMLISTSFVMWATYLVTGIMYNLSMVRLFGSTSRRINDNNTKIKGCKAVSALSFFVAVINLMYALIMTILMKDDIYNVLSMIFKGLFHFMIFLDLRRYAAIFTEEDISAEDSEEETTEEEE